MLENSFQISVGRAEPFAVMTSLLRNDLIWDTGWWSISETEFLEVLPCFIIIMGLVIDPKKNLFKN